MKDGIIKIKFSEMYFKKGDIIELEYNNGIKHFAKVITTPKMTVWKKLISFFGFKVKNYYAVKILHYGK